MIADETAVPADFVLRTNQSYDLMRDTVVCLSEEAVQAYLGGGIERHYAELPNRCRRMKLDGFVPVRKRLGYSAPAFSTAQDEDGDLLCTTPDRTFRCRKKLYKYGFIEGKARRDSDGEWIKVFVQMDDRVTVADPEQPAQPGPRGKAAP